MNIKENTLKEILGDGAIPRVARVWERLGYKRSVRWLYGLTEDFKPERGLNFWQKSKLLALSASEAQKLALQNDLFASLTEREKLKIPFGAWVERFFRIVGEITALVVSDKREMIRLKMAELVVLSRMEWV